MNSRSRCQVSYSENHPLLSNHLVRSSDLTSTMLISCTTLCIPSKTGILLILYSVIIGSLYSAIFAVGAVIAFKIVHKNFIGESYIISLTYILVSLTTIVVPFGGIIADIFCGKFKAYMISLFLMILGLLLIATAFFIIFVDFRVLRFHSPLSFLQIVLFIIFGASAILFTIGFACYVATYVHFIHDQLMEAPTRYLSLSTHWVMWADQVGYSVIIPFFISSFCFSQKFMLITLCVISIASLISIVCMLVFSFLKRQWFHIEPRQRNPYKMVVKILNFARKHKYPLQRSAFTYCDDEIPSRLDNAKERFGGPFTTEQVEDVKTLFRLIIVLLAIGPIFVLEIPSSLYFLPLLGAHLSSEMGRYDHSLCSSRWIIMESHSLRYIISLLFFPIYLIVIFLIFRNIPRILSRLRIGIILYLLGGISLFILDTIGHVKNKEAQCLFDITLTNNTRYFSTLHLPWEVLIPPNIFFGIGPLLVMISTFEFISAQSPQSMKGLLVGVLFAIKGLFLLVSSIALFPFSLQNLWSSNDHFASRILSTDCVFGYLLFTCVVSLIGLILFSIATKWYKLRERDDRPFDHRFAQHFFSRVIQERLAHEKIDSEIENES